MVAGEGGVKGAEKWGDNGKKVGDKGASGISLFWGRKNCNPPRGAGNPRYAAVV